MKTDRLRINQLLPNTYECYLTYLEAIDTKNVDASSCFLTEDCIMHSNNNPPVRGKVAIAANKTTTPDLNQIKAIAKKYGNDYLN